MWKYLQILERFINFTLHIWLLQALRRCHVSVFSYIFYFSPLRAPISRVINNVWLWWLAFSVFPFYLFIFIANRLYMSLTARILVRLDSLRGRFGRDGEQDETVRWRQTHQTLDALREKKVLLMAATDRDSSGTIQSAICSKHRKWIGQKQLANSSIKNPRQSFCSLPTLPCFSARCCFSWI